MSTVSNAIIASYSSFNQRRYGTPWVCTMTPAGKYDFSQRVGTYTGDGYQGEAVYFNRAWKHGKETWVIQGIGETLVIGRDRQKRRSRTFTQLPQAEKYLARMGFKAAP